MRITILAAGSRGDVQPYIALSAGLVAAGHQVRLATHAIFAPLIEPYGVELFPSSGNPREMLESETAQAMLATGGNPLGFLRNFARLLEPHFRQLIDDSLRACQGADAVIFSGVGLFSGYDLAEHAGLPACAAMLQPAVPTRAFASPFFPEAPGWLPGRGLYNLLSHRAFLKLLQVCFGPVLRKVRREMGLPPPPAKTTVGTHPLLYGFSPAVIAPPPDWPSNVQVTGYWFLDRPADWQPSEALLRFLAAGPPPVYIGFGSMRNRRPEETTALAVAALTRAGRRGVLLTGWGGLDSAQLPDTIFPIESIPHDWLFPRMAAVVHHGGAGTTAAGLRAGVPSILVPFFADQPFWARRVYQLGVGPRPLPRAQLTVERLTAAITTAVTDPILRDRAAALGARIRAEDGIGNAVTIIERYFAQFISML